MIYVSQAQCGAAVKQQMAREGMQVTGEEAGVVRTQAFQSGSIHSFSARKNPRRGGSGGKLMTSILVKSCDIPQGECLEFLGKCVVGVALPSPACGGKRG